MGAFLKDAYAGVDSSLREPALHLGLQNRNDFIAVKDELLKVSAIVHIEPAIAAEKADVSAFIEEWGCMGPEVAVQVRAAGELRPINLRNDNYYYKTSRIQEIL